MNTTPPSSSGHMDATTAHKAMRKMNSGVIATLAICTAIRFFGSTTETLAATTISPVDIEDLREIGFNQSVYVSFDVTNGEDIETPAGFHAIVHQHPDWVMRVDDKNVINEIAVRKFFEDSEEKLFSHVTHSTVDSIQSGSVLRAQLSDDAHDGFVIDAAAAARALRLAYENNEQSITIPLIYEEPSIVLSDAENTLTLERLARGISDFDKSGLARQANIRKALEQHMNGVIIEPGETFSFNDAMSDDQHWHQALVIVNETQLVPEAGGGICQAATTAFRAALIAGLPIEKRANHSLYVGYYEEYGVGLDATVYNDKQDFVFRNDTANTIIMQARVEGTKAVVELYGVPDNRIVNIDGPFFAQNAPEEIKFYGNPLTTNQIAWTREVVKTDGTVADETLISTYKGFPRQLWKKFIEDNSKMLLVSL